MSRPAQIRSGEHEGQPGSGSAAPSGRPWEMQKIRRAWEASLPRGMRYPKDQPASDSCQVLIDRGPLRAPEYMPVDQAIEFAKKSSRTLNEVLAFHYERDPQPVPGADFVNAVVHNSRMAAGLCLGVAMGCGLSPLLPPSAAAAGFTLAFEPSPDAVAGYNFQFNMPSIGVTNLVIPLGLYSFTNRIVLISTNGNSVVALPIDSTTTPPSVTILVPSALDGRIIEATATAVSVDGIESFPSNMVRAPVWGLAAGLPEMVTNVVATATSTNAVSISWSGVPQAVTAYKVSFGTMIGPRYGPVRWTETVGAGTAASFQMSFLVPGANLFCQVAAVGPEGAGPMSSPARFSLPLTAASPLPVLSSSRPDPNAPTDPVLTWPTICSLTLDRDSAGQPIRSGTFSLKGPPKSRFAILRALGLQGHWSTTVTGQFGDGPIPGSSEFPASAVVRLDAVAGSDPRAAEMSYFIVVRTN